MTSDGGCSTEAGMTVSIQIFEDLLPNGTDHADSAGAHVGAGPSPREAFARFIDERTGPIGRVVGSEREPAGSHVFAIWVSDDAINWASASTLRSPWVRTSSISNRFGLASAFATRANCSNSASLGRTSVLMRHSVSYGAP